MDEFVRVGALVKTVGDGDDGRHARGAGAGSETETSFRWFGRGQWARCASAPSKGGAGTRGRIRLHCRTEDPGVYDAVDVVARTMPTAVRHAIPVNVVG